MFPRAPLLPLLPLLLFSNRASPAFAFLRPFLPRSTVLHAVPRYGPPASSFPIDPPGSGDGPHRRRLERDVTVTGPDPHLLDADFFGDGRQEAWERREDAEAADRAERYRDLLNGVLGLLAAGTAEAEAEIPGLVGRNVDVVLSMRGYEGNALFRNVVENVRRDRGEAAAERVAKAVDLIRDFCEEFAQQARGMEREHQGVLGKIVEAMAEQKERGREEGDVRPEDLLDEVIAAQREHFTPGFLRHLEGQIERIAAAPKMTADSVRMAETLQIVRVRAVEEMGKDLGEAASVLGRLVGYERVEERRAVLRAGLEARGTEFAREMGKLAQEALEGFEEKGEGVADPELVQRVQGIDWEIRSFLEAGKMP